MNGVPAGPEIDALRASVAELFERRVTEGSAPGSFFAVFSPRGIEFEGGFGASVLGGAVPDRDTAFRIASCTKSFTAATLLQLRDRGLLALDLPITDFVPLTQLMGGLPAAVPTVRMLMAMSGGLPTDDPWGDAQESISTSELTELAGAGVRFISTPGTAYEYSNLGYALLGLVIEAVTGRRYVDVVTEDLLRPLGLKIGFDEGLDAAAVARGYRKSDGQWLDLPFSSPGAFSPIGGLFSTADDLVRWSRWLCGAFAQEDSAQDVLLASTRREMQQAQRYIVEGEATSPRSYGFGLFVEQHPTAGRTVYHSGGYPGFSSHMRWHEQSGWGIVAFENATYAGVSQPAQEALRLVLEQVQPEGVVVHPWPETLALATRATGLLHHWDDVVADEIFTANVQTDQPYPERRAALAAALEAIGPLDASAEVSGTAEDPSQLVWYLPAARGRLRCWIILTPHARPLIQLFRFAAEPAE